MKEITLNSGGLSLRCFRVNTAVVGSGAAGYNAADRLFAFGQEDILLLTEQRTAGTSRNAGSDKQTYYKLTLSGGEPDSVGEMAETLFSGRCVDGDIALCEAALSTQSFFRLVELGVEFPRNRWGEYIGYKTDHDPRRRATSAGPYTSRSMTEVLERSVCSKGIPVLDNAQVIKILVKDGHVLGLLCFNTKSSGPSDRFILVQCSNVVYATGGPAGMYSSSVFPCSQYGASGLAFEAGVRGRNLTEWQYGIGSVAPRWNISGSYMQVLPRIFSVDGDGSNEHEFLMDYFSSAEEMLSKLFLKGYQWPFDVRKLHDGSSIIDILVFLELRKGKRVYLDYRSNPVGGAFDFERLEPEAREYLRKAGADFGTPYQRLCHMNMPAVELYMDKGVDLGKEPLEVAICAQHNNGGLAVDSWWQTNVSGFFAVGEAAGCHGVYRPGGCALNSGQVGGIRAAQYICRLRSGPENEETDFPALAGQAVEEMESLAEAALSRGGDLRALYKTAAEQMSRSASAIRSRRDIEALLDCVREQLANYSCLAAASGESQLSWVFRLRDILLAQQVYLSAMADYILSGGRSRGSALYSDESGSKPAPSLPDYLRFRLEDESVPSLIQEIEYENGDCISYWREPRPIPTDDDFFENVWRSYRENKNIID